MVPDPTPRGPQALGESAVIELFAIGGVQLLVGGAVGMVLGQTVKQAIRAAAIALGVLLGIGTLLHLSGLVEVFDSATIESILGTLHSITAAGPSSLGIEATHAEEELTGNMDVDEAALESGSIINALPDGVLIIAGLALGFIGGFRA